MRIEELGPAACRVRLASDDARSAALILTGLDADFTVESPETEQPAEHADRGARPRGNDALVDEVRRLAARYARATGAQPTAPPTR